MSRYAIRSTLAGLTLALTAGVVATPSFAAAAADAPVASSQKEGRHGHHHRAAMGRGGMVIPGLGPVSKAQLESLKLDADQQALIKQARDAQRELFKARREAGASRHALLDKQLADGKLDPRALLSASESGRDQFREQAGKVRDQWLAVWDSLNDTQRGQVAEIVKERQARMKQRHAKMAEHAKQWRAAHQQAAAGAS